MVLKSVKDVLLKEVREALKELATSILQHLKNAGQETWSRLPLERLFLLYCRSDDVLEENSEYYCLRLLLDSRSPHATYFIDLFHQLEWLLVALMPPKLGHSFCDHQYIMSRDKLPWDLCLKAARLLRCIRPAASSCRFLFLHSEISRPASEYNHGSEVDLGSSLRRILQALSQRSLHMNTLSELQERFWELELNSRDQEASMARRIFRSRKSKLSQPTMKVTVTEIESQISNLTKDIMIQQSHCFKNLKILGGVYMEREGMGMLRKAKADRAFPTDSFNAAVKFLPFENLDKYAEINRVELGAKLGEGSFATVYEGNFMTGNHSTDQTSRKVGPTRAVKVFGNGLEESSSSESAGSNIRTRKLGSQFLKQMEAVEKLNEKARSTKCSMEESVHSFSSSTTADYSKLSYGLQATASHDSFNQTEKKITNGELSEELWRLVTAKHPNVISAFGYIGKRDQGESGLVMELMSTSLHKYLKQVAKPPLPELEVVDLMLEIAKGMRFLHECDIVHRDLKPQNVLLRFNKQPINGRRFCTMYEGLPTVEVKLADFGLAQCLNCMEEDAPPKRLETESCQVVGTHCYMAPELLQYSQPQPTSNNQSSQQPPRSKSKYKMDVFSYGTTCFNILTCYKDATALNEVILAAGSRNKAARFYEAVKSNEWRASVKGKPEYLVDLIAKCWAFDPSERPTFAKICCLLQRALLCILAPPVIDEQALGVSLNSRHVLGDVLEPIVGSSNITHHVIGSFQMNESIRDFAELARKNKFEGIFDRPWNRFCDVLWLCAREFKHQLLWSFKHNNSLDVQSETSVRVLVLQQESRNNSLDVQSETSVRVLVLQQESRRAEVQQFIHIPLTTMDLEWKVYNVLVWCSICSHFLPTHRSQQLMTASRHNERKEDFLKYTLEPFPFEKDAAKVGLDVDKSLMPFLVCFWELSGNDPFFPIWEGGMRFL